MSKQWKHFKQQHKMWGSVNNYECKLTYITLVLYISYLETSLLNFPIQIFSKLWCFFCHMQRQLIHILHPLNGIFSWDSQHQKSKPFWIRFYWSKIWWGNSGISWTICKSFALCSRQITTTYYTSAHGSGRRYYILLLKFLSFFLSFFLSPQDLRDGSTDREPF